MADRDPRDDPRFWRLIDPKSYDAVDPHQASLPRFGESIVSIRELIMTAFRRFCILASDRYPPSTTAFDAKHNETFLQLDILAVDVVIQFFAASIKDWWGLFESCGRDWEKFMVLLDAKYSAGGYSRAEIAREMQSEAILLEKPDIAKMYGKIAMLEEEREQDERPPWRR